MRPSPSQQQIVVAGMFPAMVKVLNGRQHCRLCNLKLVYSRPVIISSRDIGYHVDTAHHKLPC
jgi:hypothetical protein